VVDSVNRDGLRVIVALPSGEGAVLYFSPMRPSGSSETRTLQGAGQGAELRGVRVRTAPLEPSAKAVSADRPSADPKSTLADGITGMNSLYVVAYLSGRSRQEPAGPAGPAGAGRSRQEPAGAGRSRQEPAGAGRSREELRQGED
jgi:hypothetical protein